eukprot:6762172-Ditylum_brightwellii.AAC.1
MQYDNYIFPPLPAFPQPTMPMHNTTTTQTTRNANTQNAIFRSQQTPKSSTSQEYQHHFKTQPKSIKLEMDVGAVVGE